MKTKLSTRHYLSFILAGLVGQIAWAIENNYLNLFVFAASGKFDFIPVMTAVSAVVATLATLFFGVLSDRLGKRKILVSAGYIIWGITIIAFAFIMPNTGKLSYFQIGLPITGLLSGTLIVIMDCVMTLFGSGANDAAFSAYVTDNTDITNRGKVESIISLMPLVSLAAVVVIGTLLVQRGEGDARAAYWDIFFFIFGGITIIIGIICIFLMPKDVVKPNKSQSYAENLIHGFRPSEVKKNGMLYLSLLCFMIFNIGIQVFMPYFFIYLEKTQKIVYTKYLLTIGLVMVFTVFLTLFFGSYMDKIGKNKFLYPSIGFGIIGSIAMFFSGEIASIIVSGIILMIGYLTGTTILSAKIRDYTPKNEAGLFQGVRMIFATMIPMVIGPYIGKWASLIDKQTYIDQFGQESILPNKYIFIFSAVVLALSVIPIVFLMRGERKRAEEHKKQLSN